MMQCSKLIKQIIGWFLFAEAFSWILNYIGITLRLRFDESLSLTHLVAGHVVLGLAALCFAFWYRLSILDR